MKRRETFEAGTREDAEALAAECIKRHPGCRVDSIAAHAGTGAKRGVPIGTGGTWIVVVEYEDAPKPA